MRADLDTLRNQVNNNLTITINSIQVPIMQSGQMTLVDIASHLLYRRDSVNVYDLPLASIRQPNLTSDDSISVARRIRRYRRPAAVRARNAIAGIYRR